MLSSGRFSAKAAKDNKDKPGPDISSQYRKPNEKKKMFTEKP